MGPTTKKVAQIILEWVEEGEDVPEYFKKRLDAIQRGAAQAYKGIEKLNLALGDELSIMKDLYNVMDKELLKAFKDVSFGTEFMVRAAEAKDVADARRVKDEEKRVRDEKRMGQRRVERMNRLSRAFGWLGYKLTMMGRIVTRWVMAPIQMTVKGLTDLEGSMMTTATAMGLGAMFGQDFSASLLPLLSQLPMLSMETQAAAATIKSELLVMATEIGPELNELQWMIVQFLDDFGPGFAEGFADGIDDMTTSLEPFLKAVMPYSDDIGKFSSKLIPLAIGLTALGVALFFLSPALKVLAMLGGIMLGPGTLAAYGLAGAGEAITEKVEEKATGMWTDVHPALGFLYEALANIIPGMGGGGWSRNWWEEIFGGGTTGGIPGVGAAPGGDINIYGDIHVPEGVDVDWLFGLFAEYQRRQKEGYDVEPGK